MAQKPKPKPLFIARQGRRPTGLFGYVVAFVMPRETAKDNRQAIALLDVGARDRVLDVGTGHGASLGRLAMLAGEGTVTGADYSDVMLRVAKRRNRRLISEGRVQVLRANSDRLPFDTASFDKILTMHTLYFWDPAEPHLREIRRVLAPNGTFVMGFRPAEDEAVAAILPAPVYRMRTTDEVLALLRTAGLDVVGSERRNRRGDSMVWLKVRHGGQSDS